MYNKLSSRLFGHVLCTCSVCNTVLCVNGIALLYPSSSIFPHSNEGDPVVICVNNGDPFFALFVCKFCSITIFTSALSQPYKHS